ncbi:uncharacterized protein LOC133189684 [Saccostrea echinata]|uniref:uncharacterized protein LOC133189684 n=1 Tax=Saccostrea echinata TaxID=191078 RepID=UPI002A8145FC|nr:uncharacterized protein LOC133189684 [Saccostrea echinata]
MYLFMDTRNTDLRDNTFGDFEVLGDGRLVNTLYRWFPDLEECRITALKFDPLNSNSPQSETVTFEVTRMSTKERLGTQTILYMNDHPGKGFVIMHQETHIDTYLITTRQRNPLDLEVDIEATLLALNLDPKIFRIKSSNYGKAQANH